jgi:hypothetical protein
MVGPLTKLLKRLEHGRCEGAAGLEAGPNVWELLVKAPTAAGRPPITSRNSVLDDADRRAEEIRRRGVAEARSVIARARRADLARRPLARRRVRLRLMMTELTSRHEPPGHEQAGPQLA